MPKTPFTYLKGGMDWLLSPFNTFIKYIYSLTTSY
jgi:hypothetical protein